MKGFSYDGPIMSFLSRVADILILNVLTLIFSIPLITIGAATTAAHYTALKMRREEGHVWSSFWKSFKENLKQSTGIWLIFAVYWLVSVLSYNIAVQMSGTMATLVQGVIMATLILSALLYVWVMPLQARFINPIKGTFKNAFYMAFKYFFRTLLMLLLNLLPVGTLVVIIFFIGMRGLGIWLLFGIAAPIYWCAMTYDKVFEKLEEMILENQQMEQIEEE